MTNQTPLFTRRQIRDLTGLDAGALEYWTKHKILVPVNAGGGKGQHLKFDGGQVTLGRILAELTQLGLKGNALRDLAEEFRASWEWFSAQGIGDAVAAASSLIEYRRDIVENGYVIIPDNGSDIGVLSGRHRGKRELNWEQVIAYHREMHFKDDITDDLVRICESVDLEKYTKYTERYLSTHPSKGISMYIEKMYISIKNEEYIVSFHTEPNVLAHICVNIAQLKRDLWNW